MSVTARNGLISTSLCSPGLASPLDNSPGLFYSSSMRWTPDKITALVLIIIAALLLFTGIDGEVKSILVMAAGYLFGVSIADRKK